MQFLGRFFLFTSLFCICAEGVFSSINTETYLESWDPQWQPVTENLPPASGGTAGNSYNGVTLNIGFACYSFPGLNGLQFSDGDVTTVTNFVRSHRGKARISFGGASYASPCYPNYFISQTAGWPDNYASLASGVANVVTTYDLDGVDFDIEDPQPTGVTAQEFADQLIMFLQAVRDNLPSAILSITIPGQGWNTYWQYLAQGVAAVEGLVNYIQFMEYDIWVNPAVGYPGQIEADILTYTSPTTAYPGPNYAQGWGLPPGLIQLGIMPGCDDNGNYLSVSNAQTLTTFAVHQQLRGVMEWDLDRDAGASETPTCSTYPSDYEYISTIRNQIDNSETIFLSPTHIFYPSKRASSVFVPFTRKSPPPHGSP